MSEKKKKKSGSIAIPFLVTIFIGMILVGGAAFFIYHTYIKKEKTLDEPPQRNSSISLSAKDNHTILMILDDPAGGSASSTFMLVRSLPYKRKLLLVGIPSNSIYYSAEKGGQLKLKDTYERNGAEEAEALIEKMLGIKIDKYIVFSPDSFNWVCDKVFGSVSYQVDIEFKGVTGDGSTQTLDAEKILKYITYNKFSGGESERSNKAATLVQKMIQSSSGSRISQNLDVYFSTLFNMTALTDITAADYNNYKDAIKYLLALPKTNDETQTINTEDTINANVSLIDGKAVGNDYIISSNFINNLPKEYFYNDED